MRANQRLTVNALRVFWVTITLWYELIVFSQSVKHCSWPDSELLSSGQQEKASHVLVIADPQILDHRSYPDRPRVLTYLTRLVVDLNLRKNWQAALGLQPDVIIFLGDMMDNGRHSMSEEEYERYYLRFKDIFKVPSTIPVYFLPGNHDIGLQTPTAFSPHARTRYKLHFGPLNHRQLIANHTMIFIDAPGLVEEDNERVRLKRSYNEWHGFKGGTIEFIRSITIEQRPDPIILFSHIPLFRENTDCGPLREKGTIRPGGGLGYENTLGKDATRFVLQTLRPSVVFSGDDHDYCEFHHFAHEVDQIREVSVKSLSMAMGIQRPGFQLLSLTPQGILNNQTVNSQTHVDTPCFLPDQLGIYLDIYVPLLFVSLFVVLVANKLRARGSTITMHYTTRKSSPNSPRLANLHHRPISTSSPNGASGYVEGNNREAPSAEILPHPASINSGPNRLGRHSWTINILGRRPGMTIGTLSWNLASFLCPRPMRTRNTRKPGRTTESDLALKYRHMSSSATSPNPGHSVVP